ncbi:hypothetical protein [Agrobacterium sp. NPDC090273]|uniref:hypothetical protein n=1 Tax=Agrobacterium sp. NPDC090273 TaxID=3363919 RepID=UPI003839D884
MGDLHERLVAREALEASFEVLIAQGVQASLDYVQVTVAPQLANLKTSIDLAQEQIDQIIIGGKAPDTLKFGGQLPAYYATAQALTDGLAGKVSNTLKVNGKELSGDIQLQQADVGLDKVNNTADADKPVSTPQQVALDKKVGVDAPQSFTQAQKAQARANLDIGFMSANRNKLINGDFDYAFWGNKTIPAGTSEFTCDRWIIDNQTNQPVTFNHVAQVPGQTDVPSSPRAKLRLIFAAAPTTGYVRILQRVESVHTLAGKVASARGYFSTPNGPGTLSCSVIQHFGGGGSPSPSVITPAISLDLPKTFDPSTTERKAVFNVPPISGKLLGTIGGDYLGVFWDFQPRTAGNYDISHMSLVEGDASLEPDPFAAVHHSMTRAMCYRYHEVIATYARFFATGGGQALNVPQYITPKRVIPAIQFIGLGQGANLSSYGWADVSADNILRFEIVSASNGDAFALQATYRLMSEI